MRKLQSKYVKKITRKSYQNEAIKSRELLKQKAAKVLNDDESRLRGSMKIMKSE